MTFNNDTTICGGNEVLLNANVTQGRPDYIYNWSPNISNTDTTTVTPGADITYTLTVTDDCGLSITDQVTITVYPIMQIMIIILLPIKQFNFSINLRVRLRMNGILEIIHLILLQPMQTLFIIMQQMEHIRLH